MILEKLKTIIETKLGIDTTNVTEQTNFKDELINDSIIMVELLMSVEEEFNIQIDEENLENLKTVGDIIKIIEKKI